MVRWILPKRFLTHNSTTSSNTVNNTPLECDREEKLTNDNEILKDTVETTEDDDMITVANKISETNAISCNDNEDIVENSSTSNRVIFGLYD